MKQLTLEKEEGIDGITVYKVFYGVMCLRREEEVGPNAAICIDGRTEAQTKASAYYQECLSRVNAGYPKITILASKEMDQNDLEDVKLGQEQ